jgi:hypothetical protein
MRVQLLALSTGFEKVVLSEAQQADTPIPLILQTSCNPQGQFLTSPIRITILEELLPSLSVSGSTPPLNNPLPSNPLGIAIIMRKSTPTGACSSQARFLVFMEVLVLSRVESFLVNVLGLPRNTFQLYPFATICSAKVPMAHSPITHTDIIPLHMQGSLCVQITPVFHLHFFIGFLAPGFYILPPFQNNNDGDDKDGEDGVNPMNMGGRKRAKRGSRPGGREREEPGGGTGGGDS